ncbi:MAG: type III secretion system inner membrane ring lipoprotein SctJ [Rhabdochlamydiaceae bacterium]
MKLPITNTIMKLIKNTGLPFVLMLILTGCGAKTTIVNDLSEREANEIIVFLANREIPSSKIVSSSSQKGGSNQETLWNIQVEASQSTEAMSLLNQNGLPRRKGTSLLHLFSGGGLMTTDKEETIRYQAGLAEQIANTIRKIDGVLDADVQISFPPTDNNQLPGAPPPPLQKVTASVYVKHQGIMDDPNSHLITKIKRLVASAVNGLDINDVTIIADRARFNEPSSTQELMPAHVKEHISIWSIVISQESASRFRLLFGLFSFMIVIFFLSTVWLIWKIYPLIKDKEGLKALFQIKPFSIDNPKEDLTPPKPEA